MNEVSASATAAIAPDDVLREDLAQGDALLGTIPPILRHLLANDDKSVFSDEIIARVRGMLSTLAGQLLAPATGTRTDEQAAPVDDRLTQQLIAELVANPAFLMHIHALALEWQLTERLQARLSLDPVLTPLVQNLIASPDRDTATLAVNLLASQARFAQTMRRMTLSLGELPGDLLHAALVTLRTVSGNSAEADARAQAAEREIRGNYDEAASRLGLISRLVSGMGGGAVSALSVTHAGVAMFLTALSLASGQDRDMAVLATNEAQAGRLALSLRASGLKAAGIEEQFLSLHPDIVLPDGFDRISADRAAAMLAAAQHFAGD